jgi:NAD(P)H-dependent FMN reductase
VVRLGRAGRRPFDVEVIDLKEVNLPLLDEPNHPRLQQYTREHTRRWSETISRGDAYVFVHPEYNHGYNAALKNALDYLFCVFAARSARGSAPVGPGPRDSRAISSLHLLRFNSARRSCRRGGG